MTSMQEMLHGVNHSVHDAVRDRLEAQPTIGLNTSESITSPVVHDSRMRGWTRLLTAGLVGFLVSNCVARPSRSIGSNIGLSVTPGTGYLFVRSFVHGWLLHRARATATCSMSHITVALCFRQGRHDNGD
jgi:hypothetical protein